MVTRIPLVVTCVPPVVTRVPPVVTRVPPVVTRVPSWSLVFPRGARGHSCSLVCRLVGLFITDRKNIRDLLSNFQQFNITQIYTAAAS